MTDIRTMFDKDYIGSWDLKGDTVVTIQSVKAKKVKNAQQKENKRPIVQLAEFEKPMIFNVTNSNTVASLYGPHVENWTGKKITLYPTQTQVAGRDTDCIRVRPIVPTDAKPKPRGLDFISVDGDVATFAKGGEWLAFAESSVATASPQACGDLWDKNSDVFYSIQAAVTKGTDQSAIDRVAALGKSWHQKINATSGATP